ncbi:MAG TPA: glycosyltransferase family 39 protein [Solirubrobacterales bacterium]|nr:glycosyltransferase family 39 protein [Solirubrobacterales bacterium]
MTRETPPQTAPQERPNRPGFLRDPVVRSILVYAGVAIAAALAAYYAIFTNFALYDDEGTLLVTVQAFAHGDVLYRDVYSPYGPFYYELFGGLFALTGKAVTTDVSRSIVIVLWIATSLLYGISAQRLTGRLALGAAAMIAAFAPLGVLANEPMHPQGLCVLLLGGITLLAVSASERRPAAWGALAGALLAALLLTKLNLGAYAIAAAGLAAALTLEPLRSRAWIRWPVAAAAVVMPLAVAAQDLNQESVRNLVAVEMLALAAIVVAGWRLGEGARERGLSRWLLGALAGFAVAAVAIMVAILLAGSSLADVYGGMVTEAARVREVNPTAFPMSPAVIDWAIGALAVAVLAVRLRRPEPGGPSVWAGGLRILAGAVIWLTIMRIAPVALNPSAQNQISLPVVLSWVAVLPPGGARESQFKRFGRIFLPALAVAQALQVYPVAGSQMGIAALTFVPVGAICIADGLAVVREWSAARGRDGLERFGVVAAVALLAFAVDLGVNAIVRPGINSFDNYRHATALPFPGATALHLPEEQVQAYEAMVGALHEHGCTDFIGYPNIDSLYLWSGIEPPPPAAPGVWLEALDSEKQQRIVNELRASKKPCAIRSEARAALWLSGRPAPPQRPLVRYIFDDFKPVLTVGEFEFMLPK